MRRRITIAILGTVLAALVVAGLATLVLDRVGARSDTEQLLRRQAPGVAELVAPAAARGGRPQNRPALRRVLDGFRLEGIAFFYIGPAGAQYGALPAGVPEDAVDVPRLLAGETVSGHQGGTVYAMAPTSSPNGVLVAVLTKQVDTSLGPGFRWFVPAAAATLVLGVLVALYVSRALTEPLRRAEAATHRIAAGDLATRLPAPVAGRTDELGDLARSINTMAEGLERSRVLEQQFLLSVSHDLRTPLTSIRGYAEAISDGTAPDPRAAAAIVLSESRRLERLVRDLLDLARLDARQFSFDARSVPVGAVVADAAEGFRRRAEDAGLALAVDRDPSATVVVTDPDRLAQIVANLVENGLKFARSTLRVSTVAGADDVAVVVTDDGPGIAPEDLPHVFERLYVSRHRPVRTEAGSGLGLAIVRELVTAMGGTVACESPTSAAGGTRMVVRLRLPG